MPRAAMLLRDVNNLTAYLGRFAPELLDTWYAEEIWALFEAGDLRADSATDRATSSMTRAKSTWMACAPRSTMPARKP